jgi:16S rRNA (guanine966-N2)-methyltransferase
MRIIGGERRGAKIRYPRSKKGLRPTSDKVREALFAILGDRISGARVLDLFAGTGSLGLEALSRGAERCAFVDLDPDCMKALWNNIVKLDYKRRVTINRIDLFRGAGPLQKTDPPFDVVFLDPPYNFLRKFRFRRALAKLLDGLVSHGILAPAGIAVLEYRKGELKGLELKELRCVDTRNYGDTAISFFAHRESGPSDGLSPEESS